MKPNFRISLDFDYRIVSFEKTKVTILFREFYLKATFNYSNSFVRKSLGEGGMIFPFVAVSMDEIDAKAADLVTKLHHLDFTKEFGLTFSQAQKLANEILQSLPMEHTMINFEKIFKDWETVIVK